MTSTTSYQARYIDSLLEKLEAVDVMFYTIRQTRLHSERTLEVMRLIYSMTMTSIKKIWPYINYYHQSLIHQGVKSYEEEIKTLLDSKAEFQSLGQHCLRPLNEEVSL
ncbi:MAG: hypothetical protein NZL83_02850 [Candidatus Absconditabacterales bacterium]|nr:hypothetical protein [Candidatus Absconditabacterales bacterium]